MQGLASQVNGQQPLSTCRLCERRPNSCRRIAGLYTVTVHTKGTYNPVVEIPPEACSINITELAPSQNYLGQPSVCVSVSVCLSRFDLTSSPVCLGLTPFLAQCVCLSVSIWPHI